MAAEADPLALTEADLSLGPVIGRGSYAVVHAATLRGLPVCVKVWSIRILSVQ